MATKSPARCASTARPPKKAAGKVYMVRARAVRRCGRRRLLASRRPQRGERGQHARERQRQVQVPRHLGARRRRARQGPLGARRRRGDGQHGEHDARARSAGDARSLRDHQRRQGAERRARFRRGVLRRAPHDMRVLDDIWERIVERGEGRGARHRHDDGGRGHQRRVERAAERVPRAVLSRRISSASAASPTRRTKKAFAEQLRKTLTRRPMPPVAGGRCSPFAAGVRARRPTWATSAGSCRRCS